MPQLAYLESAALDGPQIPSRRKLKLSSSKIASAEQAQVVIHDISETGLLLECSLEITAGEQIEVMMPQLGARCLFVAWTSGRYLGCEFIDSSGPAGKSIPRAPDIRALPKRASPEAVSLAAFQLQELSMAVERISKVLERAIDQLSKRK